jgi:hypothetical protein
LAKREQHELTPDAVDRITRVVHSMVEDRIERGVDLSGPMQCDSCGLEKPAAGSAVYGAYRLCNDCLRDFTLALAANSVDNVADYVSHRVESPNGSAELGSSPVRPPLSLDREGVA